MKNFEKEKLKLLFGDILKGFSIASYKEKELYLKHLNIIDSAELDYQKHIFYTNAVNKGLQSLEEKEKYLIEENLWSEEKNKKINELKLYINNLKLTKSKLFKQKDIENVKKQIEQEQLELNKLFFLKNELIGFTAEQFATKKSNEYFIYTSLYQDESLKNKFFSKVSYDELSEEEIDELSLIYNKKISNFSTSNLKKISISSNFLNIFNISDENAYHLYGKNIVNLTYYQIEIFNHAKYFRNIISESKHKPPQEFFDDPDKLIEWLESSKNAEEIMSKPNNKSKGNQEFVASSIIGADKNDLDKINKDKSAVNLHDIAEKKGGSLSMEDFIKIHKI